MSNDKPHGSPIETKYFVVYGPNRETTAKGGSKTRQEAERIADAETRKPVFIHTVVTYEEPWPPPQL